MCKQCKQMYISTEKVFKFYTYYFIFFLGSHEKIGLFSCEDNFHGNEFLQTMKTIWKQSSIKSFIQKFLSASEKISGYISTKISGLNAKSEIKFDKIIVQKIQEGQNLLGNLTFDCKVDEVEIVGTALNSDFNHKGFTKPDRICGNVTNDCQNIINFRNDLGGFHLHLCFFLYQFSTKMN